jgi:hypothetical protein
MRLFLENMVQGKIESVVPAKDIWKHVQASVYTERIGKDLAIAIANDYPMLFMRP